jgi:CTP:molybdopterin cytidylyltransferase MocA
MSSTATGLVVLAAGSGTRMGGVAKALLRCKDGRTFLETIVTTARAVGLREVVVVVAAPFAGEVAIAATKLGCSPIVNPAPERGMASSVACGFSWLVERAACNAAWLWPVDHPSVSSSTLEALHAALGPHAAARPMFQGRRGHPPLIAQSLWPALAGCADVEGGARTVLAAADTIDVSVDDPRVLRDVDAPEDMESL